MKLSPTLQHVLLSTVYPALATALLTIASSIRDQVAGGSIVAPTLSAGAAATLRALVISYLHSVLPIPGAPPLPPQPPVVTQTIPANAAPQTVVVPPKAP